MCIVYDVVFHPTALRLAANERFKNLLVVTALEGIEQRFPKHRLSRDTKFPKMAFKVRYQTCRNLHILLL